MPTPPRHPEPANFVYITDATTVKGKVGVITLQAAAQPQVVYEVAVVKNSPHLAAAYRFITRLIRPPELKKYGFGLRPKASK